MKKIAYTPTEDQAKFLSLYQKVQGVESSQDIISLALDKLEREEKSALYDKLGELLNGNSNSNRTASPITSLVSSAPASYAEGND